MKTKELLGMSLAVCLMAIGLTACLDDDNDEKAKVTDYREYELTVASKELLGMVFSGGNNYFSMVYAVKKEGAQAWEPFSAIQDFSYEEGYEYHIKISETWYLDYRMGDPAWVEYKLLEVLSKEKGESEGLPANLLPDGYSCLDVERRYLIEADKKEEVEDFLMNRSYLFLCKQYVFNEGLTEFAIFNKDALDPLMGAGKLERKTRTDDNFPDSYKLLPLEGQVMGKEQWTFILGPITDRTSLTMDAFIVRLPGGTGNGGGTRAYVWLYQDLTESVRKEFPDAGVKTVVIAQIIGYK